MILQTFKLSIIDLKLTCSTSVYKNLSLILKIDNRIYNIVTSSGLFDGSINLKSKSIDTVVFQLDTQRQKYLPKQVTFKLFKKIEFQLNLTYRTGKINNKIYPLNFNYFILRKKGHYEKQVKINQRLYSFNVTLIAVSTTIDTLNQNSTLGSLSRIKSQQRFDRYGPKFPQSEKKRRYSKFDSPKQQSVIKYTINQSIKITRPQKIESSPLLQAPSLNQQRQTEILKEQYKQEFSQDQSQLESNKQKYETSLIKKSRTPITSYKRKSIFSKYQPQQSSKIGSSVISNGKNTNIRMQRMEEKVIQLQKKLQQEQKRNYKLEKQLSGLRNKIQHLYHEKTILLRQKEEERLVFETRDKEQKMRQRRDVEQLRRVYEGQIKDKDETIMKMQKQLIEMRQIQEKKRLQVKLAEMSRRQEMHQREIQNCYEQIRILNDRIRELQGQLEKVGRYQNRLEQGGKSSRQSFRLKREFLDQNQQEDLKQEKQQKSKYKSRKYYAHEQQGSIIDQYNQVDHDLAIPREQELLELMEQQSRTYNQMISKLQHSLNTLQRQYQQEVRKNQSIIDESAQYKIQLENELRTQIENDLRQKIENELRYKMQRERQRMQNSIRSKLETQLRSQLQIQQKSNQCQKCRQNQSKYEQNQTNTQKYQQFSTISLNKSKLYRSHTLTDLNTMEKIKTTISIDLPPKTIQYHPFNQKGTEKIRTKQTTRYKITIYPQSQVVYIPASELRSQGSFLRESSASEGYGKNYNLYQKFSQQPYKTNGYLGTPINIKQIGGQQNEIRVQQNKNSKIRSNQENFNKSNGQTSFTKDKMKSEFRQNMGQNQFQNLKNLKTTQTQEYLELIDQFQTHHYNQNSQNENMNNFNKDNNSSPIKVNTRPNKYKRREQGNEKKRKEEINYYKYQKIHSPIKYNQINEKYIKINPNNNKGQINYQTKNINQHQHQQTQHQSINNISNKDDDLIIKREEDSYINQNGNYVKTSVIEIYQKNATSNIN